MQDQSKTKNQLIEEMTTMRRRMAELQQRVVELETSAIAAWQAGEQLPASEERFRQFILSFGDHIYVTEVTETGRRINLYLSTNVEKLTGYSEAQLMTDWAFWPSQIVHPDDRAAAAVQAAQLTRGQQSEVEYRLKRADGRTIWVRDSARVELIGASKIVYGVVTDISERKQREAALARLLELSRALVTHHSPNEVLDQAIKAATEIAPAADRGSLQLLDETGQTLRTVAISSADEALGQTLIFRPGVGIAGHALATNQTINVPDVLIDSRFIPGDMPLRFRALLVAPLVVKGRLLGTLSLSSPKIDAFSAADETLVQLIADQVAAALENARLFSSHVQAEKLRKAHQFLQATIDALTSHIAILDETGRIIAVNAPWQRYVEITGFGDPNDSVGANYLELCDSATGPNAAAAPLIAEGVRRVILGQRSQFYLEYPAYTTQTQYWFGLRVTHFQDEGATWVVVAHEDVTERRSVEDTLRISESRFRSLIQNSSDIVTLLAADGTVQYISSPVQRILGYQAEDVVGHNIFNYLHPDDQARVQTRFNQVVQHPGVDDTLTEFRIRSADGSWLWLEAVSNNLLDDPHVQNVVINARDISPRKQVEEQLRLLEAQFLQAQKMDAVGRLAGGVAHDFNNVLTVITGYADLLLFRLGKRNPLRPFVEEIKKASNQAALVTRQLLIFSRQEMAQPEVIDLNAVVFDIEKMLTRLIGEDVELVTVLDPNLGMIKANPGHIEQVLMNLVLNARDAMPQGGELTLRTANVTIDEVVLYQPMPVQPGQYVQLTISDSGMGMDEQTMSHIFEPFYTTKGPGKGTGLGLSTVYAIVTQSKGSVQVFSQPGQGTIFNVYLPYLTEPTRSVSKRRKTEGFIPVAGKKTETILLVEDQTKLRELAKLVLQGQGYHVLEAQHADEALQISRQSREPIHLILTDVVMPGGISGSELVEQVKSLLPETKVIYMSGYTDDVIVRHGVLHSTINFLQKPFAPNVLLTKVRQVLDESK